MSDFLSKKEREAVLQFLEQITSPVFKYPSANFIFHLLALAEQVLVKQPMLLEIKPTVTFVGDIHGNWESLYAIVNNTLVSTEWKRYTNEKLLFLGDYVDRGKESIRCVLFLATLVILFPKQVFLLRGNHETMAVNKEYGFLKECEERYKDEKDQVHVAFNNFFSYLSVAARVSGRILCMHGCVTLETDLDRINDYKKPTTSISFGHPFHVLLWGDCINGIEVGEGRKKPKCLANKMRKTSFMMNEEAVRVFLEKWNLAAIIRGHQYPALGINLQVDSRFVTIFSSNNYARNNEAVTVTIHHNFETTYTFYKMVEGDNVIFDPRDDVTEYKEDEDLLAKTLNDLAENNESRKALKLTLDAEKKAAEEAAKKARQQAEEEQDDDYNFDDEEEVAEKPKPVEKKKATPAKQVKADSKTKVEKKKTPQTKSKETPSKTNDKKKDEKKSKDSASKPKPKKGPLPSSSSTIPLLMIMCILAGSVSGSPTTASSEFANNSLTLARLVNGIYLGQSVATLDKRALIVELFPIGPNLTLDNLDSFNAKQLAEDLGSIQKVVGSECGGEGGCEVSKAVLDGMRVVEKLKEHVPMIEKLLQDTQSGSFLEVNKMVSVIRRINSFNNFKRAVLDLFNTLETNSDKITTMERLVNELRTKQKLLLLWDPKLYATFVNTLLTIRTEFEQFNSAEKLSQTLKSHSDSIDKLKNELNTIKDKYGNLSPSINRNVFQSISSNVDRLLDLNTAAHNERNLANGFFDGFNDLKTVLTDDENPWLKEFLNAGEQLTNVASKLSSLEGLVKKIDPLNVPYNKLKSESNDQTFSLQTPLEKIVETASEISTLLSSYLGCAKSLNLGITYNGNVDELLKKVEMSAETTAKLDNVNTFFTNATVDSTFPTFPLLIEKLENFTSNDFGLGNFLQKDVLINETIASLEAFDAKIKELDLGSLDSWLSQIEIKSLNDGLNKWNQDTGFIMAMNCLKNEDYIGKIQKLNPSVKSISSLNVEPIRKLANSVQELSGVWNKIKPTLKTKSKRSSDSELEDAKKISKDLGDISSITFQLDRMLVKKADLNAIIAGRPAIDTAINSIPDPKVKEVLKKMWTAENVKALEINLKTAEAVSKEVKSEKMKRVEEFREPFKKAADVVPCEIDLRRLAMLTKGTIMDQKVAKSLESSKDLDVKFVKYQKTRVDGMIDPLQSYIDSVFGKQGDCSGFGNYVLIFCMVGGLLLIFLLIILFVCICKRKKIKEKSAPCLDRTKTILLLTLRRGKIDRRNSTSQNAQEQVKPLTAQNAQKQVKPLTAQKTLVLIPVGRIAINSNEVKPPAKTPVGKQNINIPPQLQVQYGVSQVDGEYIVIETNDLKTFNERADATTTETTDEGQQVHFECDEGVVEAVHVILTSEYETTIRIKMNHYMPKHDVEEYIIRRREHFIALFEKIRVALENEHKQVSMSYFSKGMYARSRVETDTSETGTTIGNDIFKKIGKLTQRFLIGDHLIIDPEENVPEYKDGQTVSSKTYRSIEGATISSKDLKTMEENTKTATDISSRAPGGREAFRSVWKFIKSLLPSRRESPEPILAETMANEISIFVPLNLRINDETETLTKLFLAEAKQRNEEFPYKVFAHSKNEIAQQAENEEEDEERQRLLPEQLV